MDIQLKVDFDRQVLAGVCQLSVRVVAKNASHIMLDVLALASWLPNSALMDRLLISLKCFFLFVLTKQRVW